MTRASWNQMTLGAVIVPLVGLVFCGVSMFVLGATDRAGIIVAYAIATMPLAAGLGAGGLYLASRTPKGPWVAGAVSALAGAVIAAMVAATIRFRQTGATGFVSLSALPYTAEFLMLAGVSPALLVLGAGIARRQAFHGALPAVAWCLAAGVAASALVGLTLIVVRGLGSLPLLNPVVLWILLAATIAGVGWRRIEAERSS